MLQSAAQRVTLAAIRLISLDANLRSEAFDERDQFFRRFSLQPSQTNRTDQSGLSRTKDRNRSTVDSMKSAAL